MFRFVRSLAAAAFLPPLALFAASLLAAQLLPAIHQPSPWPGLPLMLLEAFLYLGVGVPLYLFARRFRQPKRSAVATAGLVIGAAAPAVLFWPSNSSGDSLFGYWHGAWVQFADAGVPTAYAWLRYAEAVVYSAVHASITLLIFVLGHSKGLASRAEI